ncbi:MAG TPA: hypothetical protein VF152_03555 [Acidimicrobiia bacterium]
MGKFVQVIEYQTSKFEEMQKAADEYQEATAGRRTTGRVLECEDRDRPGTYVTIVEFPSYEEAMKNNDLPETAQLAEKMQALADGPPTFRNLDVRDVTEG